MLEHVSIRPPAPPAPMGHPRRAGEPLTAARGPIVAVDAASNRCRTHVFRVERPWGYELIFAVTENYCGKLLFVRAGDALSLQYHERKDETLYLESGLATLEVGEDGRIEATTVRPGMAFRLRPGTLHRLRAIAHSTFLEVSTPELDDVVRVDDRYGPAREAYEQRGSTVEEGL
jgi:mannose-6-phosphate isomerase